jgi:dihydroxy-acid dehydratase
MLRGVDRAPARAMLKAAGFTAADLEKPLVAVVNTWTEGGPCNLNLRDLAEKVKAGVRGSGSPWRKTSWTSRSPVCSSKIAG